MPENQTGSLVHAPQRPLSTFHKIYFSWVGCTFHLIALKAVYTLTDIIFLHSFKASHDHNIFWWDLVNFALENLHSLQKIQFKSVFSERIFCENFLFISKLEKIRDTWICQNPPPLFHNFPLRISDICLKEKYAMNFFGCYLEINSFWQIQASFRKGSRF